MEKDPAKTIIEYLGGAHKVAAIVNKHPSRVYRWAYPSEKREGQGGLIPSKDQIKLLDFCHSHKIDLKPEDFFSPDRIKGIISPKQKERVA